MAVASSPPWAFEVDERRCFLDTPYDPTFVGAVRTVPGRFWDAQEKSWSVWVTTPDRAWSVRRLIGRFDAFTALGDARDRLDALVAERWTDRFDLELVAPERDGPVCLSLCEDWNDNELQALVTTHRVTRHPETGRVSLALTSPLAHDLRRLAARRDDIRLSRRLTDQIGTQSSLSRRAGTPGTYGRTSVRFDGGRQWLLIRTPRLRWFARSLPHARASGPDALLAPATPLVASELVKLLSQEPAPQLSPSVESWLRRASRWDAVVSAAAVNGTPRFVIAGNGAPAPTLLATEGVEHIDGELWAFPLDESGRTLLLKLLADHPHIAVDERTVRCLSFLAEHAEPPPPAILRVVEDAEDPQFVLDELWGDGLAEPFAALPGGGRARTGDEADGGPRVLADAWKPKTVEGFASERGVTLDAAARELLERLLDEHRHGEELVALSRARSDVLDVPGLTGSLMPFQAAGVRYALERRRTFLADEQGLGKTVQALATLEADAAYPAIIVCPASLKLNWLREAKRWLPHRRAALVTGRSLAAAPDTELVIVNYEIVGDHHDDLIARAPAALILDESHYCKNPSATRTRAALALAEQLPEDALRLALTGTPVVNRPKELVPQLRILGRLGEFDSGASFERRFAGAEHRERLHWHLRRSCYVRRLKRDVLKQLPAKQRATVPLALDNETEYRKAERDLVAWLRARFADPQEFRRRVDRALRAEALVKINTLRQLAGHGKRRAAAAWIDDFLVSGEKLVVFAAHRVVQEALVERFPEAARLLGTDSHTERDRQVERFQDDAETRLCICSLKVAAHGLTLTAAANTAFVELGWTPAEHDQAEDRCHRIGQASAVTAWYLLAADTIDERLVALIDHKRALVGSVIDGNTPTDASMLDDLLAEFVAHRDPVA